ncbi:MAG TPA: hypothetical protein VKU41_03405 [Polyangiaceae bacterium]|nr:hypothetical protein [Polyangiaceae bacterium]
MGTRRLVVVLVLAFGCGGQTAAPPSPAFSSPPDDDAYGGAFAAFDAPVAADDPSAAPTGPPNLADAQATDDAAATSDSASAPPFDAGPDGLCGRPPGAGDLRIDELMIESVAGASDNGEWVEVASTVDCAIDLRGLHGDCPRGAKVATFDVTDDFWIPARGTFVVADSRNPAVNHDLPGALLLWVGQKGDVLPNKGGTLTLRLGDTLVDTLTYPSLALTVGTSLAFPTDCDASVRGDFSRWQPSTSSWFPGFLGTPNAPNTDVTCP